MTALTNYIPWQEAVAEGKKILAQGDKNMWRLAELAARVNPIHDDQTVAKYAAAIGLDERTVRQHRQVYQRFGQIGGRPPKSFTVCIQLVGLRPEEIEEAEEIIASRPNSATSRGAREAKQEVKRRRRRRDTMTVDKCADKATKMFHNFFGSGTELDQYITTIKNNIDELDDRKRSRLQDTITKLIARLERALSRSNLVQLTHRRS